MAGGQAALHPAAGGVRVPLAGEAHPPALLAAMSAPLNRRMSVKHWHCDSRWAQPQLHTVSSPRAGVCNTRAGNAERGDGLVIPPDGRTGVHPWISSGANHRRGLSLQPCTNGRRRRRARRRPCSTSRQTRWGPPLVYRGYHPRTGVFLNWTVNPEPVRAGRRRRRAWRRPCSTSRRTRWGSPMDFYWGADHRLGPFT